MKVLVTGGAGFIGSALVRQYICRTEATVINLDKLTYAASLESVAEAEAFFKRALTVSKEPLGPDHSEVAFSLNRLAKVYRAQGEDAEAAKLEARAKAIRAKHAEQNPAK